jgi:hypothetical protein
VFHGNLPIALSICPRIAIMFTPSNSLVKIKMGRLHQVWEKQKDTKALRPARGCFQSAEAVNSATA